MAYGTKYKIEFQNINSNNYTIEIQKDGYAGSITTLIGDSKPLIIENNNTNIYEPIVGSGCVVRFNSNGNDISDLYSINPFENRILIKKDTITSHIFYINCESYSENISATNSLIEITGNDGLNALNSVKYFTDTTKPYLKGRATVAQIIATCLSDLSINYIYTKNKILNSTHTVTDELFTNLYLDLSNFIDEDFVSMSKREVLENVLKSFGLVLRIANNCAWIYNPQSVTDSSLIFKKYNSTFTTYISELSVDNKILLNNNVKLLDNNQKIDIIAGYNKIIFNYSPYPDEKKILTFEKDFNKWVNNYSDFGSITYSTYAAGDGYYYRHSTLDFASTQNVTLNNGAYVSQFVNGIENNTPPETDFMENTYLSIGKFALYPMDSNYASIVINGGYIYTLNTGVTTNYLTINFNAKSFTPAAIGVSVNRIQIGFRIQVGSKYGRQDSSGQIIVDSSTPQTCYVYHTNYKNDIKDESHNLSIKIKKINEGGNITISLMRYIKYYHLNTDGSFSEWNEFDDTNYAYMTFKNFTIGFGNTSIPNDDIEDIKYNSITFSKESKIELNINGYISNRINIIDRGLITLNNGDGAALWKLSTDASATYTLTDILGRLYLSQYGNSYKLFNTTIGYSLYDFFRYNTTSSDYNNVLMPFTLITSTTILNNLYYLNLGGSYDVINNEYSGAFAQIKNITEDY